MVNRFHAYLAALCALQIRLYIIVIKWVICTLTLINTKMQYSASQLVVKMKCSFIRENNERILLLIRIK